MYTTKNVNETTLFRKLSVPPFVTQTRTKPKNKSHSQQSERKYKNDLIPNVINIKSFQL